MYIIKSFSRRKNLLQLSTVDNGNICNYLAAWTVGEKKDQPPTTFFATCCSEILCPRQCSNCSNSGMHKFCNFCRGSQVLHVRLCQKPPDFVNFTRRLLAQALCILRQVGNPALPAVTSEGADFCLCKPSIALVNLPFSIITQFCWVTVWVKPCETTT